MIAIGVSYAPTLYLIFSVNVHSVDVNVYTYMYEYVKLVLSRDWSAWLQLAPEAPQTDIRDVTKDEFVNPTLLNFEFEVIHTIACRK